MKTYDQLRQAMTQVKAPLGEAIDMLYCKLGTVKEGHEDYEMMQALEEFHSIIIEEDFFFKGLQSITNVTTVYQFLTWVIEDQDIEDFEADWNFQDIITSSDDPIIIARDHYKYSERENEYLQSLLEDCRFICCREGLDIDAIIEGIKIGLQFVYEEEEV